MSTSEAVAELVFDSARDVVERVFRVPVRARCSEWAEGRIVLQGKDCAEPGPLRLSRTPYLREPLDCFSNEDIEEISLQWGTQLGKTLFSFITMGYAVDQDPGTGLYVMPDEQQAKRVLRTRIIPLFEGSPVIRQHQAGNRWDNSQERLDFDRMYIFPAWSQSPASLASFPCRYVWLDEVDKYPVWSGREADPASLAEERTKNFWNRKKVRVSSPTTHAGLINRHYRHSDRRRYWVPCPKCHEYQVLTWSQVKWPEGETLDALKYHHLAWYECEHCHAKIADKDKPRMLEQGRWAPSGCSVDRKGNLVGTPPVSAHAGFHLSSLYSPWITFGEMAAEFLRSKNEPNKLMNFINGWLAEVWVERVEEVDEDSVRKLAAEYPLGYVPRDAAFLTGGIDVQANRAYWLVRAWGYGEKSWLVAYGTVYDDDAERVAEIGGTPQTCFDKLPVRSAFPVENSSDVMPVTLWCVDGRHRTDEAYLFGRANRDIARIIMGSPTSLQGALYVATTVDRDRKRGSAIRGRFEVYRLDTVAYKDRINRLRSVLPQVWFISASASAEYWEHVTSEQKVIERNSRGRPTPMYTLRPGHERNDLWDCEVYATAAADMRGWPYRYVTRPKAPAKARREGEPKAAAWIPRKKGWVR